MTFDRSRLTHVVDGPGLNRLCTELRKLGPTVAVDLETTQLSPFGPDARVVCASVTWIPVGSTVIQTAAIGLSHPDSGLNRQWRSALAYLADTLRHTPLIAHNASFDLTWIKVHTGVNLYGQLLCDTALTSHILDENFSAGLKPRAIRDLGAEPWLDFSWKDLEADERANPDGRKLAEREEYYRMTEYCAEDTYWTYRLYQLHDKQLDLWGTDYDLQSEAQHDPDARNAVRLGEYYNLVGTRTVCALSAIEENGFALDRDWCISRLTENAVVVANADEWLSKRTLDAQEQIDMGAVRITEQLDEALSYLSTAERSWSAGSKWFLCWAQLMCAVGELRVAARTPKGRPQWSKEVLDRQAHEGAEVAGKLREMRVAMTESAYIQSWLNEAQADGRIRASYNYATTPRETSDAPVTGRLSCSKPNLQQVARSARRAFCASPGHVLVSADYSQVELRVAAFLARCPDLLATYQEGRDVHLVSGATAAQDEAVRTAQLLCLWAGVSPDRAGSEILQPVLRSQGSRVTREETHRLLRESGAFGTDQEFWRWFWWLSAGSEQPELSNGRYVFSGGVELPPGAAAQMRRMWGSRLEGDWPCASSSPHQRGPLGQSTLEFADAVRLLSQANAPLLTEVSGVDWTDLRQKGKAISFGFLFGMGAEKFVSYAETQYKVKFEISEAEALRVAFFQAWSGLSPWHQQQRKLVRQQGYVVSPLGRIRHLPDAWSDDQYLQGRAQRQAINSPVQSFANDLMMLAVWEIDQTDWIKPVAVVHDAVICEVPEDRAEEAAAIVRDAMEHRVLDDIAALGVKFDCPLVADISIGKNWAK